MGKRLRLLSSSLALLALTASVFIGAVSAGAQEASTPLKIGVDNATPSGHNFEYVDFFPRAGAVIHDGDTVDFAWNPSSPDGFHTASIVPLSGPDDSPQKTWTNHPAIQPDGDDGGGSLQFSLDLFGNQGCPQNGGLTPATACRYSGGELVSSPAEPNVPGQGAPSPHFFVTFGLESDAPTLVHFVCLIHPGMQGSLTVLPPETETAPSTQAQLDALSATQYTADTADALAAEGAANQKSVTTNSDGTHTISMTAGTATNYVEVLEMLPSRVEARPGDHVKWVTSAKKDPHTVTFPARPSSGINPLDPFGAPVCETASPPDTPATAGPPTFGCTTSPELPFNWQPAGPTAIASTSTAATSGVIANFPPPAPFPNNYSFTFPTPGTFTYACRIHDHMTGTVVVNPAALPQTGRAAAGSAPTAPSGWPFAAAVLAMMLLGAGLAGLRATRRL